MGRATLAAGALALLMATAGHAGEYVPGKTRADGLYLPPHFQGSAQVVNAAEAWFEALTLQQGGDEADKLPPAAAGAPPAPPLPAGQRR